MYAISTTDYDWFDFLKGVELNSYVNFWTPTPWNIRKLKDSERWYFMLKSPIREIGGFGEFVAYKNLTAEEAWNEFGQRNGCLDKQEFINRLQLYIDKNSQEFGGIAIDINTYKIGCVVLKNCEFWEEENYKSPNKYEIEFPSQVVKFKYFKGIDPFLDNNRSISQDFIPLSKARDENKREINQRLGQGKFKGELLKAYNNKCCITGETCPELLEAAHIQRYLCQASNHIQNGLLLRVDLHRLFDAGLLNIDENYCVQISSHLESNAYKLLNGAKITLPSNPHEFPSKKSLLDRLTNFRP